MKHGLKFTVALLIGLVVAGCQQPMAENQVSSSGRYQMSQDQKYVYITDSWTGKVWYRSVLSRDGEKWTALGSPATTQP